MSKRNPMCEARAIWGIFHLPSQKFVGFGTKVGWSGSGPAKRAFQIHNDLIKFDSCEDFIVVNLSDLYYDKLKQEVDQ